MSSTAKMPIAMPQSVSTRSTCSGVAPSSTRNCASYMYGNIIRLPTNPGPLRTATPTLFSFFANASAVASTLVPVAAPRTISTSRMMCAGLKKCMPMTASGRDVSPRDLVDAERRGVGREDGAGLRGGIDRGEHLLS